MDLKQKKQNQSKIGKVKRFYLEESYLMIKTFERPFIVCVFLIIFKHLQYFAIQVSPNILNKIKENENDVQFLQYQAFFQDNQTILTVFIYTFIAINSYLLGAFLTFFLRSTFWDLRSKGDILTSLGFQIYYYLIYMLSAVCSLLLLKNNLVSSILNLILTVIISQIFCLHEYDDRFLISDFLSMRSSWLKNIYSVLELCLLLAYTYIEGNTLLTFTIVFYTLSLILEVYYLPIYNLQIQTFNIFGYIFNIITNLNAYLTLNTSYSKNYVFSLIVFSPLSYVIAQNILKRRIHNIILDQLSRNTTQFSEENSQVQQFSSQIYLNKIDIFLRAMYNMCKLSYDDYLSSQFSIHLEYIIQNHKIFCKRYPYCFCAQEVQNQEQRESATLRSQYLNDYIENFYQKAIQGNSKIPNILFSYLMFIIQVQKNEIKAFTIALNYLQNNQATITLYQQQRLLFIITYLNKKVDEFKIQVKLANKNSEMKLDFIESINYDSLMYKSFNQFQECLQLKKAMLQNMGMNIVNLQQLYSILTHLRSKREELQKTLSYLLLLNYQSYFLHFMIESYERILQYDQSLSQQLNRQKKFINTQFNSSFLKKTLTLYSEDSCVIFITLIQNIGVVKKVTKNIYDVIPLLDNSEVIGKNINYMMAQKISLVHNDILKTFIKSHNADFQVKNYPLLIGIDNQNWAIPYLMKLQTCTLGTDDFGVSCWVKQIKDANSYMQMTYNDNFEILNISKNMYQHLFHGVIQKNSIYKVKMGALMPTLESFIRKKCSNSNQYYEGIFLKPINEKFCSSDDNFKKSENLIIKIFEMDIFKIKAEYFPLFHSCIDFIQVKVSSLERLQELQQKIEAAHQLLQEFLDLEMYDFEYVENQKQILQSYLNQRNLNFSYKNTNQQNQYQNLLKKFSQELQPFYNYEFIDFTNNDHLIENQFDFLKIDANQSQNNLKFQNQKASQNKIGFKKDGDFYKSTIHLQEYGNYFDLQSPNSNIMISAQGSNLAGYDLLSSPQEQTELLGNQQNTSIAKHLISINLNSKSDIYESKQNLETTLFHKNKQLNQQHQQPLISQNFQFNANEKQQKEKQLPNETINHNYTKNFNDQQFFKQVGLNSISSNSDHENHSKDISKYKTHQSHSKKSFKKNMNEESVNLSNKTGDSNKRQQLIQELRQPSKMTILRLLQYLGFITLLGMVVLNVVNFVQLNTYLYNQKDDYENYDWANRIQVLLTQILESQAIQNIINTHPEYLQPTEDQDTMVGDIFVQQKEQLKLFSNLLLTYQDNQVQSTLSDIIKNKIYNLILAFNVTHQIQIPLPVDYSLKNILGDVFYIVYNLNAVNQATLQLQVNMITLNNELDNVDIQIQDAIHQTFDNIQSSITTSQISDFVVAAFFSLCLIPIYIYVQHKRQEILTLFSTFGPDKIELMFETLAYTENGIEKLKQKFNQTESDQKSKIKTKKQINQYSLNMNDKLQKSLIEKKKNISNTTKLPIFNCLMLLYSVIFILVNIIYSFGMGFALSSFIQTQLNNLEYTNEIYNIHLFTSKLNSYRMVGIQTKLLKQNIVHNLYLQESNYLIQNITQQLNTFYSIINKQNELSRQDQDSFNSLNNNLMQSNACLESSYYTQYITSDGFEIDECSETDDGIFLQGMISAIKYFCEEISYTNPIFQEQDITIYKQNLEEHFQEYTLSKYYYYLVYESYMVQLIRGFIKNMTLNQYSLYTKINIILIVLQIFAFVISVIFIYLRFFNQCFQSILDTKKLLDLIDIQYLRENQYVISYFKSLK
ncbi:ubiquitin family protein (macronuclear) [Tetrahymena thermophila SB210]|uniref:Ubiquitin family protein n=1 Tax=Tetrahymena thermophila (strain SB210) TaxID=312017 RepID=W7XAA8_TETTS|nr:ubiquitin family protein [Tetrahymena thermophila SB210]EWS74282.1 ubiquitin family protein [Tetrahymena thermophila SB210]|eukprot:XP_012653170.1 ubiquitin family protein [Tetrahymena thermophila SB210]